MQKTLSSIEISTIHNTKFFEVKTTATKKIEHLFAGVRDEIKETIEKDTSIKALAELLAKKIGLLK